MKKIIFSVFLLILANSLFASTCDDIQKDPNSYFVNMVANPKDDFAYLNSNFECENSLLNLKFLKQLYKLSKEIRNENIDCVGNTAIVNEKKFQEKLAFIAIAPKIYENGLDKTQEKPNLQRYEVWSHKSIKNFMLFDKFKKEFDKANVNLTEFFKKDFDENYAKVIATTALNEYLKFAFENHKENLQFSEIEELLRQENSNIDTIRNFIFSKEFSEFDLTQGLNTALLHNKNIQILKALIECGANVNYGDENSIFFALNSPENIKFLIANGADMNYKNSFGLTPIFYVVEKKDPELLKFFIYNGAKLNVKLISNTEKMAFISSNYEPYQNLCAFNEPSKTLLMHAAGFANKNITEMLVKNGANEFVLDDFGLNALDYAILSENNETIQYLKNLGLKENIQKEEFYESETNQTKQASNF